MNWMLDAEYTHTPSDLAYMLGEDDDGQIYVGTGGTPAEPERWVPFRWWKPRHWKAYLVSRGARTLVVLEPTR